MNLRKVGKVNFLELGRVGKSPSGYGWSDEKVLNDPLFKATMKPVGRNQYVFIGKISPGRRADQKKWIKRNI